MSKIQLTDTIKDIMMKMSEGNPGALKACVTLYQTGPSIDPECLMGGMGPLLNLDTIGIYGSEIWQLWEYVCGGDPVAVQTVLRGVQLGFLPADKVRDAIRANGPLDIAATFRKVREFLPAFAPDIWSPSAARTSARPRNYFQEDH